MVIIIGQINLSNRILSEVHKSMPYHIFNVAIHFIGFSLICGNILYKYLKRYNAVLSKVFVICGGNWHC